MKKTLYKNLNPTIKSILYVSEGWLVGGAIRDILEGKTPKDYDIIVPNISLYYKIRVFLNDYCTHSLNTFGGDKFIYEGIEIDIWCEELSSFITTANYFEHAYNLKKNMLIQNTN